MVHVGGNNQIIYSYWQNSTACQGTPTTDKITIGLGCLGGQSWTVVATTATTNPSQGTTANPTQTSGTTSQTSTPGTTGGSSSAAFGIGLVLVLVVALLF